MRISKSIGALLIPVLMAGPATAEPLFDPVTGLRIAAYRAPVPEKVPGGETVGTSEVVALAKKGALLVDVRAAPGHRIDDEGRWIVAERHETLADAVWLPETGHGRLSPAMADYLRRSLARCTGGNTDHPIVIFCRNDCWMSWNAVQHAAGMGYTRIHWYPGGVEEWQDMDHPTTEARPLAVSASTCS